MPGDYTRSTFDPTRHYSGVRMQQGRVQLDADWNEQLDIQARRDRLAIEDTVGDAAGPAGRDGFRLRVSPDGSDLLLGPGRYWVRGILCEASSEETPVEAVDGARVTVGALVLDGVELAAGAWIRLGAFAGTDGDADDEAVARVVSVDAPTRTLELAGDLDPGVAWTSLSRLWSFRSQPDLPPAVRAAGASGSGPEEDTDQLDQPGNHLVYLDVWERPITFLEDPAIQDVALGGADTAIRVKTVWQLSALALEGPWEDLEPGEALEERKPTGTMAARTHEDPGADNLCAPVAGGGYTGAENQLYRVEIRSVDADQRPSSIVWSRDNATVTTGWTGGTGGILDVTGIGRDAVLGFAEGQWVELLDDAHELRRTRGTLVRVMEAEGTHLTLQVATADGPIDFASFGGGHPKVRRWDSPGAVAVTPGVWIDLEHGIQVRFSDGTYCEGDFWLIPARTATGDVDWPRSPSGEGLSRPPAGVEHSYAPVAIVQAGADLDVVADLRTSFPALSDLTSAHVAHRASDRIPGARTIEEALEYLAGRVAELEAHIASLHPDRPPPPRRRGWR